MEHPPRVLILAGDGFMQRQMIGAIAARFPLAGVVFYSPLSPKGSLRDRLDRIGRPRTLFRYVRARMALLRSRRAAAAVRQALFPRPGEIPAGVPCLTVTDINSPEATSFVRALTHDVVAVNGTNLLRGPMLEALRDVPLGIINLHTGLSPYARGGNCNLFVLRDERPELVGVTVHYLDAGIDSGDIIVTARPKLSEDDTVETIDAKVFRLGIDLMVGAIADVAAGCARRIPQWEHGQLFLRRTGYVYDPAIVVEVNDRLPEMIRTYQRERAQRDTGVLLVHRDQEAAGGC